jgi:hypothetical protein
VRRPAPGGLAQHGATPLCGSHATSTTVSTDRSGKYLRLAGSARPNRYKAPNGQRSEV